MMEMQLKLELKGSDKQINKAILTALKKHLNDVMVVAANKASVAVQSKMRRLLGEHPTVRALKGGSLADELGVPQLEVRINNIIDIWIKSMVVKVKKVSIKQGQLVGGFKLQMIKSDWTDVLQHPDSIFATEKDYTLEWLDWLLIQGSRIVVRDYDYFAKSGTGRSGQGIMNPYFGRKRWSIPYAYQGTRNNNFCTQAIEIVHTHLDKILTKAMEGAL